MTLAHPAFSENENGTREREMPSTNGTEKRLARNARPNKNGTSRQDAEKRQELDESEKKRGP
jgi:hypothetical protein